jgi:hypothetical protein
MLSNLFIEQVKKHFHYLLDSYKFSITDERVGFDNFGNALVQFKSKKVLLRITLDRGQVFIYFLPRPKFRYDWFSFSSVMNFLYPGISIESSPKNGITMMRWSMSRLQNCPIFFPSIVIQY